MPLPPDTRTVGSGNPPLDMDEVVDALVEMGETRVVRPSGVTSGVTDATLVNSIAAGFGSLGGTIFLSTPTAATGPYYWAAGIINISNPAVSIRHLGPWWACPVNAVGTGDIVRMYSVNNYLSGWGGGCQGFVIDGTSAGAGSSGFHVGDIYQLHMDCGARNFNAAGSSNFWFDNQYWYAEGMFGRIWSEKGRVIFDNSANVGGNAGGSYARMCLDIYLDLKDASDGVIFQNGAFAYNHDLGIYGNCDYSATQRYMLTLTGPPSFSFTATNASPCVFTAAGSYYTNGTPVTISGGSLPTGFTAGVYYVVGNPTGSAVFKLAATSGGTAINSTSTGSGTVIGYPYSSIFTGTTKIGIECNGTSGAHQPITILFGSQQNNTLSGTGIIDFTGGVPFAGAVNWNGSFEFDGPCMGDVNLKRVQGVGQQVYSEGPLSNGAFITTRWTSLATANPSGNITGLILGNGGGDDGGNYQFTLVNFGTGSITFAAAGTSHVATGTACVIQPGTAKTFQWLTSGIWYPTS
jgi:hypothetical protein